MPLSDSQKIRIKAILKAKILGKLTNYESETSSMPFLAKIMQDPKQVAAYSFIHSIATTLGMSVYEQVSKIIAEPNFDIAETSYDVVGTISVEENTVISNIIQEIKNGRRSADKEREIREILAFNSTTGNRHKVRADLFLKKGADEYYIEIKTAKPNIDVFSKSKQKLLEWIALRKKPVTTILAIPYNPYYPEPYSRFTMQGYLDEEKELFVAEKYWELLGGQGAYTDLLKVFDEVGKEVKDKVQEKIKLVADERMDVF